MPTICRCPSDGVWEEIRERLVIRSSTGAVESTGPRAKWRAAGTIGGRLAL